MLFVIAAVLAATAFLVLMRLLWLTARPSRYTTVITLAAAVLVLGLAVLALSGRLHWLAALAAAVFPFLRRGLRLIAYLPWLRSMLGNTADRSRSGDGGKRQRFRDNGTLTRAQALEILGLGSDPTRDEIVAAHRRLIQKLHPDRGGSNYLTQQLNDARRRLLDEL